VGDFADLLGVAPPLAGAGPRLIAWDPARYAYVFYPDAPAATLAPGRGYWARFPAASYLHFQGALVPASAPYPVALAAGWNLIGDPFPAAAPLSALTLGDGTPLLSSAAVSPTLYRYDPLAGAYAALAASDSLQPYAGYWLFARQAATLVVPPPK
jgi:hypothetical protein